MLGERNKVLINLASTTNLLHIGCSNSPDTEEKIKKNALLHSNFAERCNNILGIDIDSQSIELLKSNFPNLSFICGNLETDNNLKNEILKFNPTIIMLPDVIEHLDNQKNFLTSLHEIISPFPNSRLVITTPNALSIRSFLAAIFKLDFTNIDHKLIHNEYTLCKILLDSGFKIENLDYYDKDLLDRYGFLTNIISKIFYVITKIFPQFGDGIIVECSVS